MKYKAFFQWLLPRRLMLSLTESSRIIKNSTKMSKIKDVPHPHIDFEKGEVYGLLKQIRYADLNNIDQSTPKLIEIWCCKLKPQQSKAFIKFIREFITPYENQDFTHLKRLQKVGTGKQFYLNGVVCTSSLHSLKQELFDLLSQNTDGEMSDITPEDFFQIKVPSNPPPTRELCLEWSEKYWTMSWKGNPNFQFLKQTAFDYHKERDMVKRLLELLEDVSRQNPGKTLPVVTIVVNPQNNEIVATSQDCRLAHPLHHSVMEAIAGVAQQEKQRRLETNNEIDDTSGYLLNGLVVYTTHEPCVMCSMGLVHSRIKRLIYLKPMKNGGVESNYQLGDRDDLNWKFETWRWLGQDDLDTLDRIEKKNNFSPAINA